MRGSLQNTVLPGLKRNFTSSWLFFRPNETMLPKAASASAVRPSLVCARYTPLSVRNWSPPGVPPAARYLASASAYFSAL